MVKDPIAAGISEFVRQTISRSSLHRLLFRIFSGAGCAVILLHSVLSHFFLGSGHSYEVVSLVLAGPLIISYFLLAGRDSCSTCRFNNSRPGSLSCCSAIWPDRPSSSASGESCSSWESSRGYWRLFR